MRQSTFGPAVKHAERVPLRQERLPCHIFSSIYIVLISLNHLSDYIDLDLSESSTIYHIHKNELNAD